LRIWEERLGVDLEEIPHYDTINNFLMEAAARRVGKDPDLYDKGVVKEKMF
jgi:hypothetical protein